MGNYGVIKQVDSDGEKEVSTNTLIEVGDLGNGIFYDCSIIDRK